MSNKDTSKESNMKKKSKLDLFQKEEMLLFSFELLKSKKKFNVFNTNSFRYEFFEEKDTLKYSKDNEEPKMKINNRTISIIDEENNSSLKTLNIEVPFVQKLSQPEFKNNFLKSYNNSFAHFSGITKEQYENIYLKNKYIPVIDKLGNIKINIKNIIKVLKEYPNDIKKSEKSDKYRFKKTFIMNKRTRDNNKFPFKIKLSKQLNKKNKISNKNNNITIQPINNIINNNINNNNISNNIINKSNNNIIINSKNNINNNIQRNHNFSFNLKDKGKGLSINIPKNRNNILNNNRGMLNLGNNNSFQNLKIPNNAFPYQIGNAMNKNYIPNITNINPATINPVLSNSKQHSNSDIFNFSNKDIRNYLNFGNINNANIISTLSPNIPLLTPISPFLLSPYHGLFSAHLSNNFLQDGPNYNNIINPNPFLFPTNSPLINININNNISLNNSLSNGNNYNNISSNAQKSSSKSNNNNSNIS